MKYDVEKTIDDQLKHIANLPYNTTKPDYTNVLINISTDYIDSPHTYVYDNRMRGKWANFKINCLRYTQTLEIRLENFNTLFEYIDNRNDERFKEFHNIETFLHYYFRTIELYNEFNRDKKLTPLKFNNKATTDITQKMIDYNQKLYNEFLNEF